MKPYTPTEAHRMFNEFFTSFPDLERAVLLGVDLKEFNAAAEAAEITAKFPPSAATCLELEQYLGLMFNLLFDAPLFKTKPVYQRQTVADAIEITGAALHLAADRRRLH
ncbi:hypothetical protein [Burkholderia vietnamiensis]|uniref:hypothetical protein n=1 Tax=Burkholderia vietnamiensis TaxID=60552 RepID=UPI00075C75B5|nr:hypothetical protein [Burkholderia vietnamiensis]KVF27011.1 hypothetical protein WJ08_26030 [Burkholderia vietnamiensis]KVF39675.1 hypothetical protein WJ10_20395 [Burkholderia vietnamiensis]HDR9241416.1 hypothetical protein [Burkholderia vietnamiensis]